MWTKPSNLECSLFGDVHVSTRNLISLDLLSSRAEWSHSARTGPQNVPETANLKEDFGRFCESQYRTRVGFEVGMFQLGGHALMLSSKDSQVGRGEAVKDTAQVLSRYVDGIMIRTYDHQEVVELARYATVPIINALTDLTHPCQILADLMTCLENFPQKSLSELVITWIGDGNNMAHSWINAAGVLGFELRLACSAGFERAPDLGGCVRGGRITLCASPVEAAKNAHVSPQMSGRVRDRKKKQGTEAAFADYQVNRDIMAEAHPDSIFSLFAGASWGRGHG